MGLTLNVDAFFSWRLGENVDAKVVLGGPIDGRKGICVWTSGFFGLLLVKSLTLFPAAKVKGLELAAELCIPLKNDSVVGLFVAPKEYPLLVGFAVLMGLGRSAEGMALAGIRGGGMRSSVDEGGDGGVEKARVACGSSLPPTDALLFLGLARMPCEVVGRSSRGAVSVMGRMGRGCVFVLCRSFSMVMSGDAISSSSS